MTLSDAAIDLAIVAIFAALIMLTFYFAGASEQLI